MPTFLPRHQTREQKRRHLARHPHESPSRRWPVVSHHEYAFQSSETTFVDTALTKQRYRPTGSHGPRTKVCRGSRRHEPVHLLRLPRQAEPDDHRSQRLVEAGVFVLELFQEKSQHLLGLRIVLRVMWKTTKINEVNNRLPDRVGQGLLSYSACVRGVSGLAQAAAAQGFKLVRAD